MIPKEFHGDVKVSDGEIRATGGSERLLRVIWDRFPSIRREFGDFKTFEAFSRSIVEGRSKVCRAGTVSSRQSQQPVHCLAQ
ncbi:MAG: hypothetical protein KC643_13750 [Nitrospira sp.]|nr:hypothetical protein [Nitrospira sp.]